MSQGDKMLNEKTINEKIRSMKKKNEKSEINEREILELLQELGLYNANNNNSNTMQGNYPGRGQNYAAPMQNYNDGKMNTSKANDMYELFFEPRPGAPNNTNMFYSPLDPAMKGNPNTTSMNRMPVNYGGSGMNYNGSRLPTSKGYGVGNNAGKNNKLTNYNLKGGAPTAIQVTYLAPDGTTYQISAVSPQGNRNYVARNVTDSLYNLLMNYSGDGKSGNNYKGESKGSGKGYGSKSYGGKSSGGGSYGNKSSGSKSYGGGKAAYN